MVKTTDSPGRAAVSTKWGWVNRNQTGRRFHLQISSEGGVWCLFEQGDVGWQVAMPPRGPAWGLV